MQLQGKRVIMPGGGSGIGATTVRAFAHEGAAIVAMDIQEQAGRAVVAEATALGPGPITYMSCDISRQHDVNTVFDEAIAQLSGLDVMLNVAGNEKNVAAEDVNAKEIDFIMDVHVKGTMFTNAAAFRHMKDADGSIIYHTSLAGISGDIRGTRSTALRREPWWHGRATSTGSGGDTASGPTRWRRS